MARRIVLGNVGGVMRFRVSSPGYDAADCPLDALLFDGDNTPARVVRQGSFRAASGNVLGVETARSHGVSSTPSMCLAIARPYSTTNAGPENWYYLLNQPGGSVAYPLNKPVMDQEYCTPFFWWADQTGGATEYCGWKFNWNSTQVIVTSYYPYNLDVRWAALEF